MCAGTIILEWVKSDGCSKNTSLHITCLVLFSILADLMLGVVYNTIFRCGIQRVIFTKFIFVQGSQDRTFQSIGTSTTM